MRCQVVPSQLPFLISISNFLGPGARKLAMGVRVDSREDDNSPFEPVRPERRIPDNMLQEA